MNDYLISGIAFIFVLGVMILVHELGHYLAAKFFGVRVEVFSLGFGKRLMGFRRGETDYRISALPLGGYVKMSGENPLEGRSGDPREFSSHPRWQRFIIAAAGPAMNILLAIGLLAGVYMVHYEHPAYLEEPAVIGHVMENSPAARAGIQPGDRIIRIDSLQDPVWQDVELKTLLSPGQPLEVAVQRGKDVLVREVTPETVGPNRVGVPGWVPERTIRVASLDPKMPAYKAGIRVNDEIIALNGVPVRAIEGLLDFLQKNGGAPVNVTLLRNGVEQQIEVVPVESEIDKQRRFRLGFTPGERQHVDRLPFFQALNKSLETNRKYSVLIFELVGKMIQRKVSIRQMEGPIGIGRAAGEAARMEGWTPLLSLMVAISLNLGIFNLLPIPILDGGLILLLAIEGLMRRDINERVKAFIYQVSFVALVLFAAIVIYNDLSKTALSRFLP
jgi:regulator of sigma E protease